MDDLDFDILSLNVRGLGDHTKRRKIFNYTKKHVSRKGVIFLQETHSVQKEGNLPLNKEDLIFFWYLIAFKIKLDL